MNLKNWTWLVPMMILSIIMLPACPKSAVPYEAEAEDGGWVEIPRYESVVSVGEPIENGDEKGSVNYLDRTHYRVSVGNDLLDVGSDPLGNGSYTLIDGRYLEPDTTWYVEPWAVLAKNEKAVNDVRIVEFNRLMWQRDGVWPYMNVSNPPDDFDGIVKFKNDSPNKPRVDCDHNGNEWPRNFFGALKRIGAVLVNGWLVRETLQTLGCGLFNHTIGLAGVGAIPGWCVNVPFFKSDIPTGFDQRMVYELEDADKSGAQQYRGWLELPLAKQQVVKYQWAITYVVQKGTKPAELKHLSGIVAMDSDGDGIPDDWEINHGTDPDDINDPGNGNTDTYVPCPPPNVLWNLSQVDAALQVKGLHRGDVIPESSEIIPAGYFLHYNMPCGATVAEGTTLDVYLSSGSSYVSVPDLVGQWPNNVSDILAGVGLQKDPVLGSPEYSNVVPEGKVVRQWPVAGTQVLPGSMVKIALSLGPVSNQVSVTCVLNCTEQVAKDKLHADGFVVQVLYEHSNTVTAGKVTRQSPVCDVLVDYGSTVTIWISTGPQPPDTAVVPSILGKTEAQGAAALLAVDSRLTMLVIDRVFSSSVAEGLILYQDPTGGTTVTLPKVVNVEVSKGPQPPNELVVTITSPANNFVGTVGQQINFNATVTGGVIPYIDFKWHFPDNSFKYLEDVVKKFDIPGAGWVYFDVTDSDNTTVQEKIWVQINLSSSKSTYQGDIFWQDERYAFGSWPAEAKAALGL